MKITINKKNVGLRIKNIRLSNGMTLEEFGNLFGASKGNVQQWENGRSLPNISRIQQITEMANTTINEFLYGTLEEFIKNNFEWIIKKEFYIIDETDEILKSVNVNDFLIYFSEAKEKHNLDNSNLNDLDYLTDEIWDIICEYRIEEHKQKEIFSSNLKRLVERSNLPQNEIAKRIGVSPQTFNTWIKGIDIPRMGKIQTLADYFNIEKSDLIEEKNSTQESDISIRLEKMMSELAEQKEALMFKGELLDDDTREAVLLSMQQAVKFVEDNLKERLQKTKENR